LTRIHESGTLTGKRKGEQIFSSILYGAEFENEVTLSPYGRIDAGYTKLKSFSDSGKVASINYNEQKIKTARASIGLLIDDEIQTQRQHLCQTLELSMEKMLWMLQMQSSPMLSIQILITPSG
jgi:hypothetical protein